jgi:hypothetical protein
MAFAIKPVVTAPRSDSADSPDRESQIPTWPPPSVDRDVD